MKPIDAAWNLLKANPRDQLFGRSPDNYADFEADRPQVDRFGPLHPSVLGLLRRRMGVDTMLPEGYLDTVHPDMRLHGRDILHAPTIYEGHRTDENFEGYDGARDAHLYDDIFERGY